MADIRASAQKPLSKPAFADTGIPLETVTAGTGGQPRSQWTTATHTADPVSFVAVVDAKAFSGGLGRASSPNTVAHRNALVEELRGTQLIDVGKVKRCLQALISENKARCQGKTPEALHLYMGFGNVTADNRGKVSALAWKLHENATALMGALKDAECEQMLGWISEQWASYEHLHKEESATATGPKTYRKPMLSSSPSQATHNTSRKDVGTADLQGRADILQRATLRDKLLTALLDERPTFAQTVLRELPSTAHLKTYFPDAAPDEFNEKVWASAQGYTLQGSTPLQTYVTHCHQLAAWQRWVKDNVLKHPDAQQMFPSELRGACDALRTTHETRLSEEAPQLGQKMQAALKMPRLAETLAQQPFTSIRTMLDKCVILGPHIDASILKPFHDALEQAQALQNQATHALREGLLGDSIDEGKLKPLVMLVFARQVTTLPTDTLSSNTTLDQKNKIHWRLNTLLQLAQLNASDDSDSFYRTVLGRLDADVTRLLDPKMGTLEKEELGFAEEMEIGAINDPVVDRD